MSVLLVTVTTVEAKAVLDAFTRHTGAEWRRRHSDSKTYCELGKIGGTDVFMVQSEMGTSGPGAASLTIQDGITLLRPHAVIMVGIAFGTRPDRQRLGDILVSSLLCMYEPQKCESGGQITPRGPRVPAPTRLLDRFRSGDLDWKGARVLFGPILSGEKLINDRSFLGKLLEQEPEAIGGEMEGAGLYAAAANAKVDWILVKGICDWADGTKNDDAQPVAACNAAEFTLHVIRQCGLSISTDGKDDHPVVTSLPVALEAETEGRGQRDDVIPFTRRVLGPAGLYFPDENVVRVDLGWLVRNLVLFDRVIIDSTKLKEIPQLVSLLGYDQTLELLASGALRIYCYALTIGQIGQTDIGKRRQQHGILPLGSYSFAAVRPHDQREYVSRYMRAMSAIPGLTVKQRIKLKHAVSGVLEEVPDSFGQESVSQLERDLSENVAAAKSCIIRVLRDERRIDLDRDRLKLSIERIRERDFHVETNIGTLCGFPDEEVHRCVERALLGLGGFSQAVEEMKFFKALSGHVAKEMAFFDERLRHLAKEIDPGTQERRLLRVRTLAGAHEDDQQSPVPRLNVQRLLDIRESRECRDFRDWLTRIDSLSDTEIREQMEGVHDRIASVYPGSLGSALEFVVKTTRELPQMPPGLEAALGTIDAFLVKNVLPRRGPAAFISDVYHSIFEWGNPPDDLER